ncbi:phosphoribosylglycinamide formyltransferase [Gloeomargarita lithophora Alchichica-D10]|uniref:Phosphoribosylglycinamide formyltransferase n=1 Tax=Gloeomargarita lithophora Alchichica-D10 TaxID=1188229 RepID=A0A1J0A8S5_9CYAN|nr:phosphoribosylglycinamide formyltransferase [Gloeomargarita lithophora]APB32323.1 phosphoribosylglycinamide formyltransferase [Gloeomargarita lithophora Alchichica-D10]
MEALAVPGHWPDYRGEPLRLGILASGNGSNFTAIVQAIAAQKLPAIVTGVIYNNPGAGVAQRAREAGITSHLLNHRDYPDREAFDHDIADTLKNWGAEWVIMAGWMRQATNVLLQPFGTQVLNIHPSLLPAFPGIKAVERALHAGVKITGCTVHRVVLAVDSGPIIAQSAVPVWADDTVVTLHARIQQQEHDLYPPAILWAAVGNF